jgi:hypothetical protein
MYKIYIPFKSIWMMMAQDLGSHDVGPRKKPYKTFALKSYHSSFSSMLLLLPQ